MTNLKDKNIVILGCGWLGLALGASLSQKGFRVWGTTTSDKKKAMLAQAGIHPILFNLNENYSDPDMSFPECDFLILCIPSSGFESTHLKNFLANYPNLSKTHVILLSSTGIYTNSNSETDEISGEKILDRHSRLFETETLVKRVSGLNCTILRLGGLIGYDRQPARFATSSKVLSNPNGRINFVHRDDVIEIIIQLIEKNKTGGVFNVCCDEHPTKLEFYSHALSSANKEKISFEDVTNDSFKIILSTRIKEKLNFRFMPLNEALKK